MARPREFDMDAALMAAMKLFWEVGYEAASLAQLLAAMGITRGSFYKAFTDKRSLYLLTLDHYDDKMIGTTVSSLGDRAAGPGRQRIIGLFEHVADMAVEKGDRMGCFLCNALVDRAAQDREIEQKLQAMVTRLRNGFARALADDEKGASGTGEVTQRASGLLSAYFGMTVLIRIGLTQAMRDSCLAQVRNLLRP